MIYSVRASRTQPGFSAMTLPCYALLYNSNELSMLVLKVRSYNQNSVMQVLRRLLHSMTDDN